MPVLYRLKDTGGSRDTNVPVHSPSIVPVKRHRGEPGHSRDTQAHTRTHGGHSEDTDEPHKHPNPTTHPHDHATAETRNRGRLNNSKNSRRPGAPDHSHSPRPTDSEEAAPTPQRTRPGKKTPGGAGTHTRDTQASSAHADTRITQTNLTTHGSHRRTGYPPSLQSVRHNTPNNSLKMCCPMIAIHRAGSATCVAHLPSVKQEPFLEPTLAMNT